MAARARADEPSALGEVVVTAPSVREAGARDATAFTSVVDTRAAPSEVTTLTEVLSDTVGVQVRRYGGLGDFSTVSIRGSSAGEVQVYLDGVPLSHADNEVVNLADLPLDAVDHVEVYRGATPLAFAQAGPGGIVNVVTRRPGVEPVTGASASYGSFETRKVDLLRAATHGAWDYLAFAHYLGSKGDFLYLNDNGTPQTTDDFTVRRRDNAFNLGDVVTRVGWRPTDPLSLALTTDTFVKDEGVPGTGTVQSEDASRSTFRQLAHLDVALAPEDGRPFALDGGAYVLHQQQTFTVPLGDPAFPPTDTEDRSTAAGVQGLVRGALGQHHVPGLFLALGHEHITDTDRVRDVTSPPRTRLRATLAAEDEVLLLAERLSIVPGVRWEVFRDDFPGSTTAGIPVASGGEQVRDFTSPRLGMRADAGHGLVFLANVGRYAREPNLDELFGTAGVVKGNPDLKPEVAFNRDVGFRLTIPPRGPLAGAGFEYAFFDNQIDDLIVFVPSGVNVFRAQNVASAHVRGQEVSLRGRLWQRLSLAANYTHQDGIEESDVPFRDGKRLPGRPAEEAFARIELAWSPTCPLPLGAAAARLWPGRLFYEANVIGDDFLNRANTILVASRVYHGVGLEVAPLDRLRVSFEVKNAGNDSTSDVLDFPLPGRSLFLTVSYGFTQGPH
jgi:iron complex outermembrane receptor protein